MAIFQLVTLIASAEILAFGQPQAVPANAQTSQSQVSAQQARRTQDQTKKEPLRAPTVDYIEVLHLGNISELAEALQHVFPEFKVIPAGKKTLLILEERKPAEESVIEQCKRAVALLDTEAVREGYWIANHILHLKGLKASDVASAFKKAAEVRGSHHLAEEKFELHAVGDTILEPVAKPPLTI